jgi:hypothetical protein
MQTRTLGVLRPALLVVLVFLAGCTQSKEEQMAVELKLKDQSNVIKVLKGQVSDLDTGIQALTEQLEFLQKTKMAGNPLDAKLVKQLNDRLLSMESRVKEVETRTDAMEKTASTLTTLPPRTPVTGPVRSATTNIAETKTAKTTQSTRPALKPAAKARAPKPAPVKNAAPSGFYYTLQQGDTLAAVAATLRTSERKILLANQGPRGQRPMMGQRIYIPR